MYYYYFKRRVLGEKQVQKNSSNSLCRKQTETGQMSSAAFKSYCVKKSNVQLNYSSIEVVCGPPSC